MFEGKEGGRSSRVLSGFGDVFNVKLEGVSSTYNDYCYLDFAHNLHY